MADELPPDDNKPPTAEELLQAVLEAQKPKADTQAEIKRLSKFTLIDFEKERKPAAKRLGIRTSVLDKAVKKERPNEEPAGGGRPLELPDPEPWPGEVSGAELLDWIVDAIRRYVVVSETDAFTIALWVVHTHCFELFIISPRLAISSPERRCGKTTLMDVMGPLVARALSTINISGPALFRTVEKIAPTLLIDEADNVLHDPASELLGILNSGHRRGGQVVRTVGDGFEPRTFSTYSPCAFALIGKLPGTLADRCVTIPLKRRLPTEKIERFRLGRTDELKVLARKAIKWAKEKSDVLRDADPEMPEDLFNRDADNWRPLFAIAEAVGGEWPDRARKAARTQISIADDEFSKVQLLADIRDLFVAKGCEAMPSADLVSALILMPERAWNECQRGSKPLTQTGLARRLRPFGVFTKDMRPKGGKPIMAYVLKTFEECFSRYLLPIPLAQTQQPSEINDLGQSPSPTTIAPVGDGKTSNLLNEKDCRGSASGIGGRGVSDNLDDEKEFF